MRADILIFAPTPHGGLAEYTFHQVLALHQTGASTLCLVSRDFLEARPCPFPVEKRLCPPPAAGGPALRRRFARSASLIANELLLAWWVLKVRPKLVLLDSYVEYLAPFWVWPHLLLAQLPGVKYVANLHDPVRNYQVGPRWWHRLSVRLAYLPLHSVLVHGQLPVQAAVPAGVRVLPVTHGLFDLRPPSRPREAVRADWGAKPHHQVFLAIGYVRDGKNLDLAIRALPEIPEAFLVIAGSVASGGDRPFAYYRRLAAELGVAERTALREGFVSDGDLSGYFEAADFILLTYASTFHSQSGVLLLAVRARRPVLASAAPGPLIAAVQEFQLGIVVEPDSREAVVAGMQKLMLGASRPLWQSYEEHASWEANARDVLSLLPNPGAGAVSNRSA
jgi:glycosyltransferase involved in cell wall biosynthesis